MKTIALAMILLQAFAGLSAGAEPPIPPAGNPSTQPANEMTLDLGNGVSMKLALIPAGRFTMGSPKGEAGHQDNETQHEVTLTRDYYLEVTEVTQEQYETVMGNNPSSFKGAKNPVERVSWLDAQEFCKKLSAKTGKTARLPTEAEWEYACRAGTVTAFNTGQTISTDQANCNGSDAAQKGAYRGRTVPVASFKPNAWGLYDMHGNVWQWCQDAYQADITKVTRDPCIAGDDNSSRVLRGGSWHIDPLDCRAACRIRFLPELRDNFVGMRVAVDIH